MDPDRRFRVIEAGFNGDTATALGAISDVDALVRASAIRALARLGSLAADMHIRALADPDPEVRRTAVELAAAHPAVPVGHLVDDPDLFVAEMAAWCLGERPEPSEDDLALLIDRTTSHPEALVREACAAALGAIGDPRGLPAILAACTDKPAVRRRAILALAPFDGDEVEAMLRAALDDHDWQVRQNAEDLLNPRF